MDIRSRERFVSLLTCTVGQLCKSGLIDSELVVSRVDGLLGITLSNSEVFLINICECFHGSDSSGNSTQSHTFKISTKTAASLPLTQSNASGRAGLATSGASAKKVQTILKQTTTQVASASNSCISASFKAQSAGKAVVDLLNNSRLDFVQMPTATADTNTVKYYDNAAQNKDLMCTWIKVEENSNDGFQVIDNISRDFSQESDEQNFASKEKLSTSVLEKLEPVEENSAMFNQLCYAVDDSSYITSSSFAEPGYGDTSVSQDFYPAEPNISYDSYSQPLHPLSSSTTARQNTFPALASGKQLSVRQCKRVAPHSQNRRVEPRNKWKYHYDATTLKECIELVRSYKMSQREAERVFQIPRTTIQVKLAQMYPTWVAPPRQTFTKRNAFTAVNSSAVSDCCRKGVVQIREEPSVETA